MRVDHLREFIYDNQVRDIKLVIYPFHDERYYYEITRTDAKNLLRLFRSNAIVSCKFEGGTLYIGE
jgi:hypothetical protein